MLTRIIQLWIKAYPLHSWNYDKMPASMYSQGTIFKCNIMIFSHVTIHTQ